MRGLNTGKAIDRRQLQSIVMACLRFWSLDTWQDRVRLPIFRMCTTLARVPAIHSAASHVARL